MIKTFVIPAIKSLALCLDFSIPTYDSKTTVRASDILLNDAYFRTLSTK